MTVLDPAPVTTDTTEPAAAARAPGPLLRALHRAASFAWGLLREAFTGK